MCQSGGLKSGVRSVRYQKSIFWMIGEGLLEALNSRGTKNALEAIAASGARQSFGIRILLIIKEPDTA
jgi:hypothetical protein